MPTFPSAEEARKLTEEATIQLGLAALAQTIMNACYKSETFITAPGTGFLSDGEKQYLRGLGYEVHDSGTRSADSISWGKEDGKGTENWDTIDPVNVPLETGPLARAS